jgi:hypothetical protein
MYSTEFDASDYDYLSSGTSTQPETQTQAKTPQVSNIERFWTLTGNWGEFGLYFGAGLSASLIVRAVPVLIPSAVILFPAVGLGLGLFSLTADGPAKLRSQLILLAVATALEPELTDSPKMPNLTWYPSVLVYGAPGSGKSTFAADEVAKRKQAGHRVIVLDPHAAYGAWDGCEVIGGGMDYAAIDAKLAWFASEVGKRYKIVQTQPNPTFQPLTFVCDEFTRWGSKCANSAEFFEQLVTDIRKVEMFGLIISHTRTLAGLANAKGFASLRDEALLEVEILGNQDKDSGRATPRFEAMVKLPGQGLSDRTLVKLTKHPAPGATKSTAVDSVPSAPISLSDKPSGTPRNVPQQDSEKAGTPDGTKAERLSSMLAEILSEASPMAVFAPESTLEQEEKMELAHLVIKQDLGIEKTIWLLWGIRRGGRNHHLYTEAKAMLDRLISGTN